MTGFTDPFQPANNATTTVSATAVTGFTACPGDGECVELNNAGPNTVFINTAPGPIAVTAANGYPIFANQCKSIKMHSGDTGVNAICAATQTATLFVSRGNGS